LEIPECPTRIRFDNSFRDEPPVSAAARLRAFEDANSVRRATRINGQVERGYGSFFSAKMTARTRHDVARAQGSS